jgi:translin
MSRLDGIKASVIASLDREDALRERAYKVSRDLIRECRTDISGILSGGEEDNKGNDMESMKNELLSMLQTGVGSRFSFIDDSLVEYAEAKMLSEIVIKNRIPAPQEMGIPERIYIMGAGDCIGELRRAVMNNILYGNGDLAVRLFGNMQELYELMDGLVYPTGLLNLKRKQDVARSLIDKTAGELSIFIAARQIKHG